MLPKLKKFFDWISRNRDFDGDGLITIISHFESGIEFKPTFDVALGMPQRKGDWRLFLNYVSAAPPGFLHNWFLHQFLMEKGHQQEATKLVESILTLIEKSGFREYYNPFTAEGYGAKDFTWAGLVVDMIQMENSMDSNISSTGT